MSNSQFVRIDECRPEEWTIPEGATHLSFSNSEDQSLDVSALRGALLEQTSRRSAVTSLTIEYGSHMATTWVVPLFHNLEWVSLQGRRLTEMNELLVLRKLEHLCLDTRKSSPLSLAPLPRIAVKKLSVRLRNRADLQPLSMVKKLDWLWVGSWPLSDLAPLSGIALKSFDMNGGKAEALSGINCSQMNEGSCSLILCSKLRSLAGMDARGLYMDACKSVDFGTIQAPSLMFLEVLKGQDLNTFSFIGKCPLLRSVTVGTRTITARDTESVTRSTSLRLLSLGRDVPDSVIEAIGKANPQVFATNGNIAYFLGQKTSPQGESNVRDEISLKPESKHEELR
jgi:hypothetical protein